jgi:hypothetical protein
LRRQTPSRGTGAVWALSYQGIQTVVPDAKGLHDIAILLARPHESVAAATLAGISIPDRGEPVLDRRAAISYRARIDELAREIDDADTDHDLDRATRARRERDALLDELRRTTGRGGRPRRLGDDSERSARWSGRECTARSSWSRTTTPASLATCRPASKPATGAPTGPPNR